MLGYVLNRVPTLDLLTIATLTVLTHLKVTLGYFSVSVHLPCCYGECSDFPELKTHEHIKVRRTTS